ncbi:hypothetical protein ACM26V_16015 [Salipaludibacillus sp. HK11]
MMKKKFVLTLLSSILALGVLGACGDVENDPMNEEPLNDGGGMNDDM